MTRLWPRFLLVARCELHVLQSSVILRQVVEKSASQSTDNEDDRAVAS
jgi:hypothetical protein